MNTTVAEITGLVGGTLLQGSEAAVLTNFASLDQADRGSVSFYGNEKYREQLRATQAGLVLLSKSDVAAPDHCALVAVENPVVAFDLIVKRFGQSLIPLTPGISPHAFVGEGAALNETTVEISPNATVCAGAQIGRGSRIGPGAVIGQDVRVGEDCEIGPNVTIREGCLIGNRVILHAGVVIGADGFGFEFVDGRHRKIDQLGIVRIEDDVEVGASTTIDRARFGETVIGEGTKIDNQVQIGHNCRIGKHCIIVAQTGIAGSARIGNYVTIAAQCGIAGHIEIADRVTLAARSGVVSSIAEPGGTYFGYPAKPIKEVLRDNMRIKQIGALQKRVKELERELKAGRE
jgi:UDP-3-O-[3-hydroxymyristoyl] glucosamine N-acyltransferase